MIVKENIKINEKDFVKTYSDSDVMINKIGTEELYDIAIDIVDSQFEYIETDIPILIESVDEE